MQLTSSQKNTKTIRVTDEWSLKDAIFPLFPGDRIFFTGDLGAGKSTFIRQLLRHHLGDVDLIVRSPTYTYYQQYRSWTASSNDQKDPISSTYSNIYHFDLYRIEDFSVFVEIGGMEIAEDTQSIMLIEWPEILDEHIKPSKTIHIKRNDDESRTIILQTL